MSKKDPMEALQRLRGRLEEETTKLGLEMRGFAIIVGAEGEPPAVQCIFLVDQDQLGKDAEQIETDRQFEQMTRGLKTQEREEQEAAVEKDIRRRLASGKGFLDDAPETPLSEPYDDEDGDDNGMEIDEPSALATVPERLTPPGIRQLSREEILTPGEPAEDEAIDLESMLRGTLDDLQGD